MLKQFLQGHKPAPAFSRLGISHECNVRDTTIPDGAAKEQLQV